MCINCQNSGFHQESLSCQILSHKSLLATAWKDWAPEQIDDGVIDVAVDRTLKGLARDHTIDILDDIGGVIGTPIRITDKIEPDTDIRVGSKNSFSDLEDVSPLAAGVAHVDDNGMTNAWIKESLIDLVPIQISEKRAARRARRLEKGKPVKDLPQQLRASTKRILTHEILHGFGLSHPDNDGHNPNWDTNDSVLSYRIVGGLNYDVNYDIGPYDTAALQEIWGTP